MRSCIPGFRPTAVFISVQTICFMSIGCIVVVVLLWIFWNIVCALWVLYNFRQRLETRFVSFEWWLLLPVFWQMSCVHFVEVLLSSIFSNVFCVFCVVILLFLMPWIMSCARFVKNITFVSNFKPVCVRCVIIILASMSWNTFYVPCVVILFRLCLETCFVSVVY